MYLRKVHIENIRSIAELDWEVPEGREAGWHVLIGDNGSGKTTFLRAMALALVGYHEAFGLRQDWGNWLSRGCDYGSVRLSITTDPRLDIFYEPRSDETSRSKMDNDVRLFLSYAREDIEKVTQIYHRLAKLGFTPWMDTKDLMPGERWEAAIRRAMIEADFCLVFLSANSANKRGFIQKEIKTALDISQEKLETDVYLIPALLESCEVPAMLSAFQWVSIYEPHEWDHLIKTIKAGHARRFARQEVLALPERRELAVRLNFSREGEEVRLRDGETGFRFDQDLGEGKSGWFSVAYGPFRRFSGGDKDYERIFYANLRLAAHLSVFGENVALTECVRWLQDLQFKKLERQPEGDLLDAIMRFINQEGFLPHQAWLKEVSSRGIEFVDGNGCQLLVDELSDGYRSVLSMTFELIRQLARVYEVDRIFDPQNPFTIATPGIVLIDEVDAHLHPTWQRRIGLWFREHFPNIQFIVTTHSPLICQAADVGTVWRLPQPGSGETALQVTGTALNRLLYGDVLDAYGTELFGQDVTRSDEAHKRLERLAELNHKALRGRLTKKERAEQAELRAILPMATHVLAEEI